MNSPQHPGADEVPNDGASYEAPTFPFRSNAFSGVVHPRAVAARDFFGLSRRLQVIGVVLVAGIFLTGLLVGNSHQKYLTCYDFIRAGDYVPTNCAP